MRVTWPDFENWNLTDMTKINGISTTFRIFTIRLAMRLMYNRFISRTLGFPECHGDEGIDVC